MVSEEQGINVEDLFSNHTMVGAIDGERFPLVSIIVACKTIDPYVKECIDECLRLDYSRFELFILPDYRETSGQQRVGVYPTGPVRPSEKRNLGVDKAKGDLIAFIDGDAYPEKNWLKNSIKYFDNPDVAAVGGPGLTPGSDSTMQKASGEILSSFLGAGPLSFRHSAKIARNSDDLPTANLIVRKSTFQEVGGFDSSFWPGEDTKFCRDLVYGMGKKAVYAPDVIVYHHRRVLFGPHLKQIAGYGLHRGYFSKKFPENSRRLLYFVPSLLFLGIPTTIILAYLVQDLGIALLTPLFVYLIVIAIGALVIGITRKSLGLIIPVFLGAVATHLWYGGFFLKGLLCRKIDTHASSYKSNI